MLENQQQEFNSFIKTVQQNCDISDAKNNGLYSLCTLVLKLRNYYKWANDLPPWNEPETPILLEWIDYKEKYWESIINTHYLSYHFNETTHSHWDTHLINQKIHPVRLFYGAGYGRSLKTVFFLAEICEEFDLFGYPVIILGRELARELSSPFAMLQDKKIFIRKDSLRYYFWDQVQEIRSSCRISMQTALNCYGVMNNGIIDKNTFINQLDSIVENEINMFIYHELGESQQDSFKSNDLKLIISHFPDTSIEFVCRALKDILADTHHSGTLQYIINNKKKSSLAFYVGFLDGLRKILFPQISNAFNEFLVHEDWSIIQKATDECYKNNKTLAQKILAIVQMFTDTPISEIRSKFNKEIIYPLGLDVPK